ncbi:hypothetical protein [Ramlibacter sp. PS4R-6]|uniref:hypothetical protein n=1 Tax=Ramlibacter sp. PS4R-6 TaxID=3133438 RepID=UPI00309CA4B1
MRTLLLAPFLFALSASAADLAGRWEGVIQVPGAPQRIVVDLAAGPAGWTGSAILPGRGVKGAPLRSLQVTGTTLRAQLPEAFAAPVDPAPELALSSQPDGALAGDFRLAGNAARVLLRRTGDAQVDPPPPATGVTAQIAGTWVGRYELGGVQRQVTLKVSNDANGLAGGEIVVVGRRTSTLKVDRVVQGREFVMFEASASRFRIEGRFTTPDGSIDGQMSQGPFEAPIVLRRAPGAAS